MKTFLAVTFICLSVLSFSQTKSFLDTVWKYTKEYPPETELSIGISENGKQKLIGIKRVGDTINVIENNHNFFEIGSNSKIFTAILLAGIVNNNKVSLTDPVKIFYPFPLNKSFKDSVEMTLLNLVNHTSGLPRLPSNLKITDMSNPYKEYDTTDLYIYLKDKMDLLTTPGTKSLYSNLGFGVLGNIISKKTGLSYEQLVKEKICRPLGMEETYITLNEENKKHLIPGRDAKGDLTSNWDFKVFAPTGAIKSTANDILRFLEANINLSNIISKDLGLCQEPTFKVNEKLEVSMGWHIVKYKERRFHFHNGGTGGYTSNMTFDKENKKAVVILSNVSAFSKHMANIDKLAFNLLKND